jgi:CRISPR/Cas system-associated endoribonuclease Cas2
MQKKGITILEIVIAVAIMSIGILPIMKMFGKASKITNKTDYNKVAAYGIENILNSMLNIPMSEIEFNDSTFEKELTQADFEKFFPKYKYLPIKNSDEDRIRFFYKCEKEQDSKFVYSNYDSDESKYNKEYVRYGFYKLSIAARFKDPATNKDKEIKLEAFKGRF